MTRAWVTRKRKRPLWPIKSVWWNWTCQYRSRVGISQKWCFDRKWTFLWILDSKNDCNIFRTRIIFGINIWSFIYKPFHLVWNDDNIKCGITTVYIKWLYRAHRMATFGLRGPPMNWMVIVKGTGSGELFFALKYMEF